MDKLPSKYLNSDYDSDYKDYNDEYYQKSSIISKNAIQ